MKVCIIGAGHVGSSIAFALLFSRACSRIYLSDIDNDKLWAEILDLQDAAKIADIDCTVGVALDPCYSKEYDAIVYCAGYGRKNPQETDEHLFSLNAPIIRNAWKTYARFRGKVLIVSNPPDMLSKLWKDSIPVGDILDKARGKRTSAPILLGKGYTNWGVTSEVMRRLGIW